MPTAIGSVTRIPLRIYQGADLNFDIDWFADKAKTVPINMSAVAAKVKDKPGGATLLNLTPFITIDGTNANIAHVHVPAATTALLTPGSGVWDMNATAAASGEVKKMVRGYARIFAGVTP